MGGLKRFLSKLNLGGRDRDNDTTSCSTAANAAEAVRPSSAGLSDLVVGSPRATAPAYCTPPADERANNTSVLLDSNSDDVNTMGRVSRLRLLLNLPLAVLDSPAASTAGTRGTDCTGGGHGEAPPSTEGSGLRPNSALAPPLASPLARRVAKTAIHRWFASGDKTKSLKTFSPKSSHQPQNFALASADCESLASAPPDTGDSEAAGDELGPPHRGRDAPRSALPHHASDGGSSAVASAAASMLAELAHDHEARHGHGHGHGHSGHHGKPPVQRYASSGRMVEARAAAYAASSAASAAAAIVGSAATTPAATAARATAEEEGAAGAALNEGLRSLPIREPTALQAETVAARTLPVRHKTLPRIPLGGGGPESPLPGSASIGRSLSRYARASGASAGASSAAGTNGPASPSAGAGLRSTGMSELDGSTADTNNFSGLDTTDSLNLCTKPGSDGAEAAPSNKAAGSGARAIASAGSGTAAVSSGAPAPAAAAVAAATASAVASASVVGSASAAASTTGSRSTAASVQGYSTSTSTGVASDRSGISCGSADNTADGKPPAQTRQRAQEVAALTVQEAATTTQRQQQQQQPAVASAAAAAATLATDAATVSGVPPVKTQATAASEPTPGSPFGTAQAVSLVPAAAATAAAAAPSSAAVAAPAAASPAGAARAPKPAAYDITPAGAFVARPVPADGMVFVSNLTPTAMIEGRDGACWATSDYEITRKLHAGYASSVFKATCLVTNTDVVLKAYNLSSLSTFLRHQVLRELDIHARLTHPSVVQLYSTFKEGNLLVLVQEYVRGGSLDRVRRKLGGRMTEFQSMHLVLLPLLRSLVYLHGRGIVHRDIKPENLLFTPEWQLKLCDFGVSICLHEERAVTKTGSKEYMAPEVVVCPLKRGPDDNKENEQMAYTPAVDVWSLGALMYELLVGFTPFPGGPPARTGADPAAQLRFPSSVGEPARAFVRSCLQLHPFDRPTIPQLLKNAWVQAALESQQQHQLQLKEQGAGKVVADK